MAKKVVNPVERIERIALTGDISEPKALTPVENLMGYFPKIPQASGSIAASQPQSNDNNEGGFWNGVKNFAGTNGGRMLLGGLGTALGVGLTGGNFQDALGYGIIGAGNTASNIYKREQDAKAWAEKEAERQARKEENQANRDTQWQMLNARLDALKADRQAEYDNAVKKLGLERNMKEQERLKELEREASKYQQGREWIMNSSLDDDKKNQALLSYDAGHYGVTLPELESNNLLAEAAEIAEKGYVGLDPEALNRNEVRYIERPRSEAADVQAFNTMVANGVNPNLAMQQIGWRSIGDEVDLYGMKAGIDFNNNIRLENHKTGNEVYKKGVDAQIAEQKSQKDFERDLLRSQYDNELKKEFESYKATLPVQAVVELEQRANILRSQGYNVTAADLAAEDFLTQRLNNANIQANINKTNKEIDQLGKPGFNELQTGVNNGTISADVANQQFGQNVFQTPVKDNKPDYGDIDSFRKEFNSLTSDYRSVGDAFARIQASFNNPSPAGDLSMIFNYMKALDPDSVVRESEFANAENARAWFDKNYVPTWIRLAYEKAVNGGRLTPEQRLDFYNMATELFKSQQETFKNIFDAYGRIADERGWNRQDVLIDPYTGILNNTSGQTTAAQATPDLSNISTEELLARLQNG